MRVRAKLSGPFEMLANGAPLARISNVVADVDDGRAWIRSGDEANPGPVAIYHPERPVDVRLTAHIEVDATTLEAELAGRCSYQPTGTFSLVLGGREYTAAFGPAIGPQEVQIAIFDGAPLATAQAWIDLGATETEWRIEPPPDADRAPIGNDGRPVPLRCVYDPVMGAR